MKLLLELKGYMAEAAYDGPGALAAAERFKPDVILLDIGLPGMDGFEVSRHLHQRMGDATPFIIALTGYGQDMDRAKALDAGFDLHIVKPADIEKLMAHIANYCAACTRQSPKAKRA
jgi:CheY-like chemotaxis protein